MTNSRRAFLAALGTGTLAGCLGSGGTSEPETTAEPTTTTISKQDARALVNTEFRVTDEVVQGQDVTTEVGIYAPTRQGGLYSELREDVDAMISFYVDDNDRGNELLTASLGEWARESYDFTANVAPGKYTFEVDIKYYFKPFDLIVTKSEEFTVV